MTAQQLAQCIAQRTEPRSPLQARHVEGLDQLVGFDASASVGWPAPAAPD
jgi:hypothetical protein